MNITQLEFTARGLGESQNEKLRRIFMARPGQWIAMPELAEAIGAYAVHSRVADLRRRWGMDIRQKGARKKGSRVNMSRYYYVAPGVEEPKEEA